MRQIPLSDLALDGGHVLEWAVRAPRATTGPAAARKHASYNQQKHFAAAIAARAENAPDKNWVAMTFDLPGRADVAALEQALYLFVRRHEVLRCAFEGTGEDLSCQIIEPADVVLDRADAGHFATGDETRYHLERRFNETINTLGWPLFLMGAVVGGERTTVYMAFDHIVCDGMSLVMAVNDVHAAYEAVTTGREVELPPVGSYLDFGDLQRDRFSQLTADGPELAYWRRFVAANGDFFPRVPLDFGVGYNHMEPATNETTKLLDDAQASAFEAACRGEGAKLFQGVLAAVGIALREVSGVDVYRGLMPVGERKDPAWRQAFGWFVNTMPIEFSVAPDLDFRGVLSGVRDGWGELIGNVDTPFIKAWELLAPHYYGLRMWPFPVNFFSFIDYRKLPGAGRADAWRPTTIPEASHSNTGNMWFFRNAEGVFLNTIFPDTAQGRAAMDSYRAAIARVLHRLTDEAAHQAAPDPTPEDTAMTTGTITAPSYASGAGDLPLLGETIGDNLRRTVARHGDREALVDVPSGRRWTYAEFDAAVDAVAAGLIEYGVERGDRVGIWSPNCPEWALVQYATARIGAILVNINPTYRGHELSYVLRQSGVRLLVSAVAHRHSDYRAMVDEVRGGCPDLAEVVYFGEPGWDDLVGRGVAAGDAAVRERAATLSVDDPINIQYTSGTTGFPKGATLSHHNILNNGYFVGERLHYTAEDRVCLPVPFYHCFGMVMGNLAATSHGACIVLPGAAFEPAAALRAVQDERCTSLYGVPTMFIAELNHPDFASYDLSSLRTGIMAGSPCPVEVMKRVVEDMNMSEVAISYGMTETSPVSTMTQAEDDLARRTQTVGRVMPHVEVKIVDPATGRTAPRGEAGELCTRGYSVMLGYWADADRTAEAIDAARWMHTGDLATMDADGYVNIVGRIKDMVIRGGENIYPREIEEFLYAHPDIADVQVIGVPDDRYGEELMAWVVLRPGADELTADALRGYCAGKLAHYKIPRYVHAVTEFPMTVSGKVRKVEMRARSIELLGLHAAAAVRNA